MAQQAISRYGREVGRLLQRYAKDNGEWLARCKRAAILWDWTHGVPIEQIEREYTPNPFQGVITLG
jgi:ATP-dependent DNA helicase